MGIIRHWKKQYLLDNIIMYIESAFNLLSELREETAMSAEGVNEDFVKELLESKEQYKKSMDKWRNITCLPISTGVPVSLTALGTFATLEKDPFSIASIAGSLIIGAICSFADFNKTKKKKHNLICHKFDTLPRVKGSYECFSSTT